MEQNIILAGVGGQGILTIARALCLAGLRAGLRIKQAEVHGMSQRGGAVHSHLRISDREPVSDLIPLGAAHMILAVEPLESLRYVQYLRQDGCIIASTTPFINITDYPPVEQVLTRIARFPRHVLLDAERLSRMIGSGRSANVVLLGAASLFLDIDPAELEAAVVGLFASKGPRVAETNRLAFRVGRHAGQAYRDALERGETAAAALEWTEKLTLEELSAPEGGACQTAKKKSGPPELSGAQFEAIRALLAGAQAEGRTQLFEHEVYGLLELAEVATPPRHLFVPRHAALDGAALEQFPGERLVLKLVSPQVVHKTEARAVAFVPRAPDAVRRTLQRLLAEHAEQDVAGVLVVEFVPAETGGDGSGAPRPGLGQELFVGLRTTREFGPVIAAGIGGVDTEYLAERLRPGAAVARAVATHTSPEEFFELFQGTAAYDVLAGRARGHQRLVSDSELLRCFRMFLAIARRFCVAGGPGPTLVELEVNPFALRQQKLVPLDGRGRLGPVPVPPPPRPSDRIRNLLEPRSIAVLGVSSRSYNFGRVILNNVRDCGFPREHLYVVKDLKAEVPDRRPPAAPPPADDRAPGVPSIDGVPCLPNVASLPEPIDMVVAAVPAGQLPSLIDELADSGKVASVILIPGGVGETEGSQELERQTRAAIRRAHQRPDGGPVFVGPNSMGIQSRVGRYDTFFIPRKKLDSRWHAPPRRVAIVSQSGAFIITRLSSLELLDPALALSIGNQFDLTAADFVASLGQRDDLDVIGVYVEGFNDLDGAAFLDAVRAATAAGKVVVFYKAGRTAAGRTAAAGHTASLAGDYDVCQAAVSSAGGLLCDTFREFEQMLELATALHDKRVRGSRVAGISNAGFETVGMADNIQGPRFAVQMPPLSDGTRARLVEALARHKLDALVNARNPLDVTPMASDAAYEDCARVLLAAEEIDAVVASAVPLTPAMLTTPDEITRPGSLGERLPRLLRQTDKPLVAVIDCGELYNPLVRMLRAGGAPVFRSADQAVRTLGRYLCYRLERAARAAERPVNASINGVMPMREQAAGSCEIPGARQERTCR